MIGAAPAYRCSLSCPTACRGPEDRSHREWSAEDEARYADLRSDFGVDLDAEAAEREFWRRPPVPRCETPRAPRPPMPRLARPDAIKRRMRERRP